MENSVARNTTSVSGDRSIKNWANEPSLTEVLLLAVMSYLIYLAIKVSFNGYWPVVTTFGDNGTYMKYAAAIRHWDFASVQDGIKEFWGFPYAIVALSLVMHSSFWTALLIICGVASLGTVALSYRLWGGWVAAIFAVLSREWVERSLLGGSEPLFLVLAFGALLAARRQRWLLAALLASLSTVVRPIGIFALMGIGLVLLLRRQFRTLTWAILIGLVIGTLYTVPFKIYLGNPLANVKGYNEVDWYGGRLLTFPFFAIVHDALHGNRTSLNLVRSILWIVIVLAGIAAMFVNQQFRDYARKYAVESSFCFLNMAFLLTYNSHWARAEFPRFTLPFLPFVLLAFLPWIPKDRRLLWVFAVLSVALSALETVGFMVGLEKILRAL